METSEAVERKAIYFVRPGPKNTDATLALAQKRAQALGIESIIVATTVGRTGVKAAELFKGYNLVVVTHSTGFTEPNVQELREENRRTIIAAGAKILTGQHSFGGVGRAVRKKLGTYELEELVAYTLRIFGEGTKVACEMALMVADAGLVRTDEEVIAIAGTGRGADTALVLQPANAQTFFDLRIKEVICKPRL
ncbi:MAG: pyruvate kinase alpha/beta domain-containing protein [bacterium]